MVGIVAEVAGVAAGPAGPVAWALEPIGSILFGTPLEVIYAVDLIIAVQPFASLIAVELFAVVLFALGDKPGLWP